MNFGPFIEDQDPNTGISLPASQIEERLDHIVGYTSHIRTFGIILRHDKFHFGQHECLPFDRLHDFLRTVFEVVRSNHVEAGDA